jgi:hypothetical protein
MDLYCGGHAQPLPLGSGAIHSLGPEPTAAACSILGDKYRVADVLAHIPKSTVDKLAVINHSVLQAVSM